jgi:CYTH domain-containing protein
MTTPTGKYARIENERRFLLRPGDEEFMTMDLPRQVILDNYIIDTNLRLREVDNQGEKVYKLTKKTTLSPGREEITTIYLSPEEYEVFSKLRAVVMSKIRFIVTSGDIIIGIDTYGNEEDELGIAEVEFETEEQMKTFVLPMPYEMEVTGNEEFSGFALANRFGWQNRRF